MRNKKMKKVLLPLCAILLAIVLLLAIASERKAKQIKGGKFVKKYSLLSASSVSAALKGLLDKDFLTEDKGVYSLYDKFFVLWLEKKGLIAKPIA